MNVLINIPEEVYKHGTLGLYFDCYSEKLHDTILNGTPIPDNATNGDVIKAMFDIKEVDMENTYCVHFPKEGEIAVTTFLNIGGTQSIRKAVSDEVN